MIPTYSFTLNLLIASKSEINKLYDYNLGQIIRATAAVAYSMCDAVGHLLPLLSFPV